MKITELHPWLDQEFDGHERVFECVDRESGLLAYIAIHNSSRGVAMGGIRFWSYASPSDAVSDVLRLSRGMTYKSAMAGLNAGGGKAVIVANPSEFLNTVGSTDSVYESYVAGDEKCVVTAPSLTKEQRHQRFAAMGRFIDALGGIYVGAEDVGTSVADMVSIQTETQYIAGIDATSEFGGDPSPHTARGVFVGLKSSVEYLLKRQSLAGVTVAVQGVGNVGEALIRQLVDAGAEVTIADINADKVQRLQRELGVAVADSDKIHRLDVDVYAPCALGGAVSPFTVDQIKARIVAGAANNQLATPQMGQALRDRGILYAPDYVLNAGGIIEVCTRYLGGDEAKARASIEAIGQTLKNIFQRAKLTHTCPHQVADAMARERFQVIETPKASGL